VVGMGQEEIIQNRGCISERGLNVSSVTFLSAVTAWLLNLTCALPLMIPSPARDLKTGELLAKDTLQRRRGSWYDVLKPSVEHQRT
jgi:hypothetical protein